MCVGFGLILEWMGVFGAEASNSQKREEEEEEEEKKGREWRFLHQDTTKLL